MGMTKCNICDEWTFDWKQHICNPIFEVLHDEYNGDEWMECRGLDHEDTALRYAEKYNTDGEYGLMDCEAEIKIRNPKTGEVKVFIISAEPDVHYSASEKEE